MLYRVENRPLVPQRSGAATQSPLGRNAQFLPGIMEAAKVFDVQVAQFLETFVGDV
jgi:hypothetical protein